MRKKILSSPAITVRSTALTIDQARMKLRTNPFADPKQYKRQLVFVYPYTKEQILDIVKMIAALCLGIILSYFVPSLLNIAIRFILSA